jgi:hypothetical protein
VRQNLVQPAGPAQEVSMPRYIQLIALVVCTLLVAGSTAGEDATSLVQVRQLELKYNLGEAGTLRMRVTIASGEVIDYSTSGPEETETILRLVDLFSSGRVDLIASVDNHKVRSLQCTIRRF